VGSRRPRPRLGILDRLRRAAQLIAGIGAFDRLDRFNFQFPLAIRARICYNRGKGVIR
jgi:hypothetical protein